MFAAVKPTVPDTTPQTDVSSAAPDSNAFSPEVPEGSPPETLKEAEEAPNNETMEDQPEEPQETDPGTPQVTLPETPQTGGGIQDTKEDHGPRFKALPKEEQIMLKRAHQNLCHPSN